MPPSPQRHSPSIRVSPFGQCVAACGGPATHAPRGAFQACPWGQQSGPGLSPVGRPALQGEAPVELPWPWPAEPRRPLSVGLLSGVLSTALLGVFWQTPLGVLWCPGGQLPAATGSASTTVMERQMAVQTSRARCCVGIQYTGNTSAWLMGQRIPSKGATRDPVPRPWVELRAVGPKWRGWRRRRSAFLPVIAIGPMVGLMEISDAWRIRMIRMIQME